ncbi:MAG: CsgG/HfaB family protein [Spirochaetes bacterium]|nr:CsgG/HfaB family protein [Spirochaetota bacterium]
MRNKLALIIALVWIGSTTCSTIDVAITKKVDVNKKLNKVAVFPFDVKGAGWGDEFSDAISHCFFKTGRVDVVEREALERILREQNLSMTGLIDDKSAVKVGKLLGADVILVGRGSALRAYEKGREIPNLIDTFTLKALSVETSDILFIVRKEPGREWSGRYYAKYCFSLSLIWDRNDVLIESSRYDDISRQIVKKVLSTLDEIEKKKSLK